MAACAISLGGNLGDVPATFDRALELLTAHHEISGVTGSQLYRTTPMGAAAGDPFLNAAAVFETSLAADILLSVLQQIEHDCGRVRTLHWGPRTLDLDLLLYGDLILESPRLTVPHPAFWHRRFVLDPLVELIPDTIHPVFGTTIRQLRAKLAGRPLRICLAGEQAQRVGRLVLPNFESVLSHQISARHRENSAAELIAAYMSAIVFADPGSDASWSCRISLPDDEATAQRLMTDVLTAALDEPVRI